ncbi:MAG: tryptophan synthase subunit alpha [Candidatus Nanohalobium sp.]
MTSIEEVFENGEAFMPFTVGGYPDKETSKEIVETLVDSGANIVELGVPFSDPMADGPTITEADMEALEHDITADDVLEVASEFPDTPIVLLAYANTVRRYGYEAFFEAAEEAGVNGLIIPDMPPEMYGEEIGELDTDVNQIFLIGQNTPEERVEEIGELTQGFAYIVAVKGTTGARSSFSDKTEELMEKTEGLDVPRCIGFGISSSEHAEKALNAGADGVIMGSAIIDAYTDEGLEGVEELASEVSETVGGERS